MPAAARKGDQGIPQCSGYTISAGSGDVFINSIAAARQGDGSTPHLKPGPGKPPCSSHSASISRGSETVFVNGKPYISGSQSFLVCGTLSIKK